MAVSSAQIRAARGFLGWTQSDLADRCDLTKATIANIENNKHHLTTKTAKKIADAFNNANIEFLGSDGIRNKTDLINVWDGSEGFLRLLQDVYDSVKNNGGCVKTSGVDESLLEKSLDRDYIEMHVKRMSKINNLSFKVLISSRDYNPLAKSYAQYKTIPGQYFFPVPIYIYNRKVAFVVFDPLRVYVIENFNLFLVHGNQFDMVWEKLGSPI
jgi:transcriptional regulator with XRE-family HTH domain